MMRNVMFEVRGDILIINVDLTKNFGPSSTGKTTVVASTGGNKEIASHPGMVFGLNCFIKKPK